MILTLWTEYRHIYYKSCFINFLNHIFFNTECVSDADEKLAELFLEEKTPTNEELKVRLLLHTS